MRRRGVNWGNENQDLHIVKGENGHSGSLSFRALVVLLSFILAALVTVVIAAGCGVPVFNLIPTKVGIEWSHGQSSKQ